MKRPVDVVATLCFPVAQNRILLGEKKRKLGAGFWNGFGGRVEEGETIPSATCREMHEECGLHSTPEYLEQVATITFHYADRNEIWEVHVFFVHNWEGELRDNEEMGGFTWFTHDELPYEKMWASDREWLPRVLCGERVQGEVHFNDRKEIERTNFKSIDSFT